jgi:hypothetical protein
MSAELHDVLRDIAFQCVFVGIGACVVVLLALGLGMTVMRDQLEFLRTIWRAASTIAVVFALMATVIVNVIPK